MQSSNLEIFNKDNYERFFEVDGASFLLASMYIDIYKDLDSLVLNDEGFLSVYLRKSRTQSTRLEGLTFITDNVEFNSYRERFLESLSLWETGFIDFLSSSAMEIGQLDEFFAIAMEFFSFYRRTEFFYTDHAYKHNRSHHQSLAFNLKALEELKTQGRMLLIKFFNGSTSFLHRALEKVSKQTGIDVAELYLYSSSELENLLSNKPVEQRLLGQRKKNYVLANFEDSVYFFTSKHFEVIRQTYSSVPADLIRGTVANSGFVEGVARVIDANFYNFDELVDIIDEMIEGEVLIAETTSPDLMIACLKASAIVTNQGGLGSHAAIVSRELGIPCIVGTHNATKFINSGNIVRVDANQGLVKILS